MIIFYQINFHTHTFHTVTQFMPSIFIYVHTLYTVTNFMQSIFVHTFFKQQQNVCSQLLNSNKIYTILRLFSQFYFSDWNDKINKSRPGQWFVLALWSSVMGRMCQVLGRMCQVLGRMCQVMKKQCIKYDKGSTYNGEVRLGQWFVLALWSQVMGRMCFCTNRVGTKIDHINFVTVGKVSI